MTIVQIGAGVGRDHVYNFLKDKSSNRIILVEPMQFHHEKLKSCYEEIALKNQVSYDWCCIVPPPCEKDFVTIYYSVDDAPDYQVASINKQHILKHGYKEESIRSFQVLQTTLESILDYHHLTEIDYLFLDIEGIDAEVFLSFNLNKYEIKNIQIEHLHLGNQKDAVVQKFFDAGYRIIEAVGGIGFDTLFTK